MGQADFVTFTRQDGYKFSVRKQSVMAFMAAADVGTLVWLAMASGSDMQHVRDKIEVVARMVDAVDDVVAPAKPKPDKPAKPSIPASAKP